MYTITHTCFHLQLSVFSQKAIYFTYLKPLGLHYFVFFIGQNSQFSYLPPFLGFLSIPKDLTHFLCNL